MPAHHEHLYVSPATILSPSPKSLPAEIIYASVAFILPSKPIKLKVKMHRVDINRLIWDQDLIAISASSLYTKEHEMNAWCYRCDRIRHPKITVSTSKIFASITPSKNNYLKKEVLH
jgi:hypothetical protein